MNVANPNKAKTCALGSETAPEDSMVFCWLALAEVLAVANWPTDTVSCGTRRTQPPQLDLDSHAERTFAAGIGRAESVFAALRAEVVDEPVTRADLGKEGSRAVRVRHVRELGPNVVRVPRSPVPPFAVKALPGTEKTVLR